MAKFGPIGDSDTITLTSASQAFALGTLAAVNPAIRLIALNAQQQAWFVRFGASGAVTVSEANGMRVIPADQTAPVIIPVPSGSTHVAILADGADGEAQLSYGGFDEGEFAPAGDSQIIAVTQASQTVAIGTVASTRGALRLVSAVASISDLRIKLGAGAVTADDTDAMRVPPGSVENPTVVPITAGQTHIAIFSEGTGGDVTLTPGGINLGATLATDIQMVNAPRLIGRVGPGGGPAEELTITQALDMVGGAAQGDILYRGAADWDNLAAGTAGQQLLMTGGAGANPSWVGSSILIASGTVTNAATLDIVLTSFTGFRALEFYLQSFVPVTDDVELWMRFSTNGGSSYDATGYAWVWNGARDGAAGAVDERNAADTKIPVSGRGATATQAISNVAGEAGASLRVTLFNRTAAVFTRINWQTGWYTADQQQITAVGTAQREAAQDTDAVRFLMESGNISSGNYSVFGLS